MLPHLRQSTDAKAQSATRRERRAERKLYARIAQRPQNVRNELLEMLSKTA